MNVKVIIPTCKCVDEVALLVYQMETRRSRDLDIIYTCNESGSAAENRNTGLRQCVEGDFVIMVDDDIDKLPLCWDRYMWEPLQKNPEKFSMVSARLLNVDGTIQPVMGGHTSKRIGYAEVPTMPTAMIAFQFTGLMFDEAYKGSGWEDTDYCRQMKTVYPIKKFIINNDVKVVHKNEMKNQGGEVWVKNREYYLRKWGSE